MKLDEHYLLINGETYGPFTFEQLHELWQREELPLDTFYVRKGMREVRPLEEIINQIIAYRRPEPEAPVRKMLPDRIHPKLAVLICLVLGGLYALLSGLKALYHPDYQEAVFVSAEVRVTPVRIQIVNTDTFAWTNKLVRLNDNTDGAFQFRVIYLDSGKTLTTSLINFADGSGRRYEPWKETVLQVWIGGGGHDFHRIIPQRQ